MFIWAICSVIQGSIKWVLLKILIWIFFSTQNSLINFFLNSGAHCYLWFFAIYIDVLFELTTFILLTLPDNIMNAFFLPMLVSVDYGYHLLFFCDCLAFTFHGLHFIILIVSNKLFKKELKLMLKSLKLSSKVGHSSVNNLPRTNKNSTTVWMVMHDNINSHFHHKAQLIYASCHDFNSISFSFFKFLSFKWFKNYIFVVKIFCKFYY